MSNLIGGALPTTILQMKDRRIQQNYQIIRRMRDRINERHSVTAQPGGWSTDYWPGRVGFQGDQGTDYGIMDATWGRQMARIAQGCASRVGFIGISFDQFGTPLAGVTCSLFRTSTREWIMDVISGSNGSFLLQSWYSPDTHFIVFNKSGAPDVFGTTKQTLVGA
jgi:hypothetical protein